MRKVPHMSDDSILAHRYVLMSRSAVFEAMLFRRQKELEEQNQTTGARSDDMTIRITDVDPGIFKEILK